MAVSMGEATGAEWLECILPEDEGEYWLSVTSLERIRPGEVDNPEKVASDGDGLYWLMRVRIMNRSKQPLDIFYVKSSLRLVDQDGFEFPVNDDAHLCCFSEYSARSGLRRLYSEDLMPKITVEGAIAFLLPNEPDAQYSLDIDGGSVRVLQA